MAISAETLNIILAARDKEFTKAMDRSQKRVERFAKQSQWSDAHSPKEAGAEAMTSGDYKELVRRVDGN